MPYECHLFPQYQRSSSHNGVLYKTIQGGAKHDMTLSLRNVIDWKTATLTLHTYGKPSEILPFRVEQKLDSKIWIEYPSGCVIHTNTAAHTYASVRVQFCRSYFYRQIQFTMTINGISAHTAVPIFIERKDKKYRLTPGNNST